ncbi:MAG: hypothetical protein ACP5VE_13240 [Chthonomonadales bacterium]
MQLRREFEPFTRRYCPQCVEPCCRKPARITPTDILLATSHGWHPGPEFAARDLVAEAAALCATWLEGHEVPSTGEPCDFLGPRGCTFPHDLRPFGCTIYICPIMLREMDRASLTRIRRLIHELTRHHAVIAKLISPR